MLTDKEGLEALKKMNTHMCLTCKKTFINFKDMPKHMRETGHHMFHLVNSDLTLMVGGMKSSQKSEKAKAI